MPQLRNMRSSVPSTELVYLGAARHAGQASSELRGIGDKVTCIPKVL
jgi:hypothetical protein